MARVSTYLNFPGTTEAAFAHYRRVFGTDFETPPMRFADMPAQPGQAPLPDGAHQKIMHVALPILGGHVLMGTDVIPGAGCGDLEQGNAVTLNLEPDTRAEADRLYAALAEGGQADAPMADVFWGAYWGVVQDRFGLRWMINVNQPTQPANSAANPTNPA